MRDAIFDVRPKLYTTVIRDMLRHEDDLTDPGQSLPPTGSHSTPPRQGWRCASRRRSSLAS
jgi:hypothetical protein